MNRLQSCRVAQLPLRKTKLSQQFAHVPTFEGVWQRRKALGHKGHQLAWYASNLSRRLDDVLQNQLQKVQAQNNYQIQARPYSIYRDKPIFTNNIIIWLKFPFPIILNKTATMYQKQIHANHEIFFGMLLKNQLQIANLLLSSLRYSFVNLQIPHSQCNRQWLRLFYIFASLLFGHLKHCENISPESFNFYCLKLPQINKPGYINFDLRACFGIIGKISRACSLENPKVQRFGYLALILIFFYVLMAFGYAMMVCLCSKLRQKLKPMASDQNQNAYLSYGQIIKIMCLKSCERFQIQGTFNLQYDSLEVATNQYEKVVIDYGDQRQAKFQKNLIRFLRMIIQQPLVAKKAIIKPKKPEGYHQRPGKQ